MFNLAQPPWEVSLGGFFMLKTFLFYSHTLARNTRRIAGEQKGFGRFRLRRNFCCPFLLTGKDQRVKADIIGPPHKAGASPPCRPWPARPTQTRFGVSVFLLIISIINDYKRQQTTTVDYKRLINGLLLTWFASLRRNTI